MTIKAQINPKAEAYISKMLNKQVPYDVKVLDCHFKIKNVNVYPPGKLTVMFANYLLENNLVTNKTVVDAGAGCFALGIIAAKQGAKEAIGVDVLTEAVQCARESMASNGVLEKSVMLQGNGLDPLFPHYQGKVDLLLSGAPWDTLSAGEFDKLSPDRKALSRSFYDIDNHLIEDIFSRGSLLLSPQGRIFITASKRMMDRIERLSADHHLRYRVVKEEDIHHDGNIHYILEVIQKTNL